ncbi:MAG TPA: glycosyltransferase family 4 protein, partial [Draconibacterium sp.]|nr:glycosyltransferase family 4 protein [Draconibacterium sp.]
ENLQNFEWNLTLCGGFDEKDEYFKKIRKRISDSKMEDRITFTGEIPRPEIEKYYKKSDLLILTSYFETYSMVLQEAMAFKIPIIAANSGAVTQTADSKIAKFYEPGEIGQLEKQLRALLVNNEYNKLANGYNELDLKFLTWRKKAEQFLKILYINKCAESN